MILLNNIADVVFIAFTIPGFLIDISDCIEFIFLMFLF